LHACANSTVALKTGHYRIGTARATCISCQLSPLSISHTPLREYFPAALAAWLLGEFGDDPYRYASVKDRKN
jgi:hypothetical protein